MSPPISAYSSAASSSSPWGSAYQAAAYQAAAGAAYGAYQPWLRTSTPSTTPWEEQQRRLQESGLGGSPGGLQSLAGIKADQVKSEPGLNLQHTPIKSLENASKPLDLSAA